MAESLISKRVIFLKNHQRAFLLHAKEILRLNDIEISKLLTISSRAFTDWKKEKFSMPLKAVKTLSKLAKIDIPNDIEIKEPFWYVDKGAKSGGIAVYKKYGIIGGNQEVRKKKWQEWWKNSGQFKSNTILKARPIKKPIPSVKLAEFFGIMMGDGGISKNQISITLHHEDDKEYIDFVVKLINKLFDISPGICHRANYSVKNILISRTNLVKHLNSLGLPIGNKIKHQFDIPEWVKKKRKYRIACLRGLIDTDGCVVNHKYKVARKQYEYKKLAFTTASKPLLHSVYEILKELNFNPRIYQSRNIWLDSQNDIKKYFNIIGSNNPKHLNRYRSVI